jgi:amidohydrolase
MNKLVEKFKKEIIELNDFMADNPEIGSQEFKASEKIVSLLKKHNIEVQYPFVGMETAFRGCINKDKKTKIAILTEYDALRGMGHACGHCASGSISTLAALMINEMKDSIDMQVDILGTPDEEIMGGKAIMANKGVFDDYDLAIMIHMLDINTVYTKSLALDAYDIKFHGKPSHAAFSPWDGKNALNALRLMFDATDMMRQHVKDDVRIHGYVVNGGSASNIVPDFAHAEFLVRSRERVYLNEISDWLKDCAKAAALATKTRVEIESLGEKFHELSSKPTGEDVLEKIYRDYSLETVDTSDRTGASSDVGNVDYICPTFQPYISIGEPYKPHTHEFAECMKNEKTHDAILKGGQIIYTFIKEINENHKLLEDIKKEHKKVRKV